MAVSYHFASDLARPETGLFNDADWNLLRLGRHENQKNQTLSRTVLNAVLDAGRGQDSPLPTDFALFGPDAKPTATLQHDINLVGIFMKVRLLLLPGLKAIEIAKESVRFGQVIFLELVGREDPAFLEIEDLHAPTPSIGSFRPPTGSGPDDARVRVPWLENPSPGR